MHSVHCTPCGICYTRETINTDHQLADTKKIQKYKMRTLCYYLLLMYILMGNLKNTQTNTQSSMLWIKARWRIYARKRNQPRRRMFYELNIWQKFIIKLVFKDFILIYFQLLVKKKFVCLVSVWSCFFALLLAFLIFHFYIVSLMMIQHIEIHQFCGSRRASIWLNGFYITKVFQLLPHPPDQHTRVQNRIFFKQQQNLNI